MWTCVSLTNFTSLFIKYLSSKRHSLYLLKNKKNTLQDTVKTNYTGLPVELALQDESMREGPFFDIVVGLILLSIVLF